MNTRSGLVLVDALSEDLYNGLSPKQRAVFEKLNDAPEKYDNVRSFDQVRAASGVPAMPAIVLTADQPPLTAKEPIRRNRRLSRRQVLARSPHFHPSPARA
jgi:hypothetical protein